MTDAKGYMLHFFHVNPNVSVPGADTLLQVKHGDEIEISWHQPKQDDSLGLPMPDFLTLDDTVRIWIPNDSTLYKYWWTGNDSSCWISKELKLYGGYWQMSITCFDWADNISQYADPFTFQFIAIPGQPYSIWIKVKKK